MMENYRPSAVCDHTATTSPRPSPTLEAKGNLLQRSDRPTDEAAAWESWRQVPWGEPGCPKGRRRRTPATQIKPQNVATRNPPERGVSVRQRPAAAAYWPAFARMISLTIEHVTMRF